MQPPLTQAERDRIRDLHAQGRSRNDIATEIGRGVASVSRAAKAMGLSFDRAATKTATVAKVADAKAKRAALMNSLLDDAERLRQQLWAPTTIYSFGGKDNTYNSREVERPPFRDQRDIVQAVNTALGASLRLDLHDGDAGADEARSMIGALAAGLQVAYEQMQGAPDDSGD